MAEHQKQNEQFRLTNAYESKVEMTVRNLMKKDPNVCQCEKCFLDICAIVYNSGFSRFVTTEKGGLLAMIPDSSDNRDVDLLVAALNAIELVKEKPNH